MDESRSGITRPLSAVSNRALRSGCSERLAHIYVIDREIGRGGMATVYLARDLKHDRTVALKVLQPELAASLGTERFLREIKVAASLNHPHILPLFDSGSAGGFVYYVMPYVSGESLRERLGRDKQLPVAETIHHARAIASALDHAHRHGIVHRDVKPENIMLHEGQAMVADFGIAKAVSAAGSDTVTQTGFTLGTPAYVSPEQASGDTIDGRTDQYSLACVVYEMLRANDHLPGPLHRRSLREDSSSRRGPHAAFVRIYGRMSIAHSRKQCPSRPVIVTPRQPNLRTRLPAWRRSQTRVNADQRLSLCSFHSLSRRQRTAWTARPVQHRGSARVGIDSVTC